MQLDATIAIFRRPNPHLSSLRPILLAVLAASLWSLLAWITVDRHFRDVTDDYLTRERLNSERDLRLFSLGLTQNWETTYGVLGGIARQDAVVAALVHSDGLDTTSRRAAVLDDVQLKALSRSFYGVVGDLKIIRHMFLLDRHGICVAASTERSPNSPIGNNYGDRGYFTSAMQGAMASEFAFGRVISEPGLFLSLPVRQNGAIIGVMAAKLDAATLAPWINSADFLLADDNGVIIMARDQELISKTIASDRVDQMPEQDRLKRYRRGRFSSLLRAASDVAAGPDIVQVDHRDVPSLLITQPLQAVNGRAGLLRSLWQLGPIAQERDALLVRLWGAGMLGLAIGALLLWRQSSLGRLLRQAQKLVRQHQNAIDATTQAIAVYRADGLCLAANDGMLRLIGVSREHITDHNFRRDSLWLESGLVGAANQVIESGVSQRSHWRLNLSFGSEIWIEAAFKRFAFDGGTCLLAIFSEVTDQHLHDIKRS